jgi:hypothetical protein
LLALIAPYCPPEIVETHLLIPPAPIDMVMMALRRQIDSASSIVFHPDHPRTAK